MLNDADIAVGQPDPMQVMNLPRLKWVHLTTAGYTRYDRDDIREAFRRRGAMMTNSSMVYAEPCAEHVFAMMTGDGPAASPIRPAISSGRDLAHRRATNPVAAARRAVGADPWLRRDRNRGGRTAGAVEDER